MALARWRHDGPVRGAKGHVRNIAGRLWIGAGASVPDGAVFRAPFHFKNTADTPTVATIGQSPDTVDQAVPVVRTCDEYSTSDSRRWRTQTSLTPTTVLPAAIIRMCPADQPDVSRRASATRRDDETRYKLDINRKSSTPLDRHPHCFMCHACGGDDDYAPRRRGAARNDVCQGYAERRLRPQRPALRHLPHRGRRAPQRGRTSLAGCLACAGGLRGRADCPAAARPPNPQIRCRDRADYADASTRAARLPGRDVRAIIHNGLNKPRSRQPAYDPAQSDRRTCAPPPKTRSPDPDSGVTATPSGFDRGW